jgi:4-amino-4-deoxy-L-arabinose transferase-like glycosyltransferase
MNRDKLFGNSYIEHPYIILIILSVTFTSLFSFLIFPHLVNPLSVDYMRADGYYDIASNVINKGEFYYGSEPRFDKGAFKREPLYPLVLALTMLGGFPNSMIILQIFLYTLSVLLMYKTFIEFGADRKRVFWGAVIYAIYPYSYWYVAKPSPENIMPLFLLLNIFLFNKYIRNGKFSTLAIWGIVSGLCVLTKSSLVLLFGIGLILTITTLIRTDKSKMMLHVLSALIIFCLTLSPWIIRNYRLTGQIIWGSTMAGTSFFVGNINASMETLKSMGTNLKGESLVGREWKRIYKEKLLQKGNDIDKYKLEAEIDSLFKKKVIPWIIDHKLEFFKKIIFNFGTSWFISNYKSKSIILLGFQAPLLICCIIGVYRMFSHRIIGQFELYLLFIMVSYYLLYSMILGGARYYHVLLPLIFYFCTFSLKFPQYKNIL